MDNRLTNLSFEAWVRYVFDHPVNEALQEWYWDLDAPMWDELENPALTVRYLTLAFQHIRRTAKPYTDAQLNQGLWFLLSNACSSHMFALMDVRVPLDDRLNCIRSMHVVFEQLFAPRCSRHLGHLRRTGDSLRDDNPLDMVCYMWWDILPLGGKPDSNEGHQINGAMLDVMERTLLLKSDACRESALHGLGHMAYLYQERVAAIIDAFLAREPNLRPELYTYARSARSGCVL